MKKLLNDGARKLSKNEMKRIVGGYDPVVGDPCNVPGDCGLNNCDNPQPGVSKHWDCRNHKCTYDTLCI
jgi:natural product precursor